MRALLLCLSFLGLPLLATAAVADPPSPSSTGTQLSPEAFDAYSLGKTLAYAQDGVIWGRETYLPHQRVMWRAVGDDCKLGHWWGQDGAVCFAYEDGAPDQCWLYARGPLGLTALFLNEPGERPATVREEPEAVPCPGPEVGS